MGMTVYVVASIVVYSFVILVGVLFVWKSVYAGCVGGFGFIVRVACC